MQLEERLTARLVTRVKLSKAEQEKLFLQAALVIGKPSHISGVQIGQVAEFSALLPSVVPKYFEKATEQGPTVWAVRKSILWHAYCDWYTDNSPTPMFNPKDILRRRRRAKTLGN